MMGVGSKGTSVTEQGFGDPFALFETAEDPQATAKRVAEIKMAEKKLKDATKRHEQAIASLGTFETIGSVLEEAKATLAESKETARKTVAEAEKQAAKELDAVHKEREKINKGLRERQDKVRAREKDVGERELSIGDKEAGIQKAIDSAATREAEAVKVKNLYEIRVSKLKEAMKEAMR
jgi:hypothetical protein